MMAGTFGLRARNCGASLLFVAFSYLAYRFSPHTEGLRSFENPFLGWSGKDVLNVAAVVYGALLLVFYAWETRPGESKSINALRGIGFLLAHPRRAMMEGLPREQRLGLLTVLVKSFFAPIMFLSLFEFTSVMIANGSFLFRHLHALRDHFLPIFNAHGFWFLFQLILFLDVFFYTIGYLVEHPKLKNEIRSVEPTLLGWAVTLACYPPFNTYTARLLGGNIADFPQFESPVVHVTLNLVMLSLMAVFTWASIALNFKASNLTHRGIVARGPYRFVRHPAYVAKNLAWWLGATPAILAAWERSVWSAFLAISCVVAWNGLYVLRALTEEAHLRGVDGEYDAYSARVRYRFIPGLL